MPDLHVQLRSYLDATSDTITAEEIIGAPGGPGAPPARRPRFVRFAMAAVLLVAVGVGATVLRSRGAGPEGVVVASPDPKETEDASRRPINDPPRVSTAPSATAPLPTDEELMVSALLAVSELLELAGHRVEMIAATDEVFTFLPSADGPGYELVMDGDDTDVQAPVNVALFPFATPEAAATYLENLRAEALSADCSGFRRAFPPCEHEPGNDQSIDGFFDASDVRRGDESLVAGGCGRGCGWTELTRVDRWIMSRRTGEDLELIDLIIATAFDSLTTGEVRDYTIRSPEPTARDAYIREHAATIVQSTGDVRHEERLSAWRLSLPVNGCSWSASGHTIGEGEFNDTTHGAGAYRLLEDGRIERHDSRDETVVAADDDGYLRARAACERFGLSVADFELTQSIADAQPQPIIDQVTRASDGSYVLRATQWHYDLDARAAAAAGLIELGTDVTVEDFNVTLDGSQRWIDTIELTAEGPPATLGTPFDIDPSPFEPEPRATLDFRYEVWTESGDLPWDHLTAIAGFEELAMRLYPPE